MSKREDDFEFPEVIQVWPEPLRQEELAAQSELSDKQAEAYQWEYLLGEDG